MTLSDPTIEALDAEGFTREIDALAAMLHASVQDGASIGFVLPFTIEEAAYFWHDLVPLVASGARRLLVARIDGRIVGTGQLVLATPANGRHRAEIVKLMVHPGARRRGVARMLMQALEALARAENRALLVLDTRSGDKAEPLYLSLGFQLIGIVPRYARSITGQLEDCSFMFKLLDA